MSALCVLTIVPTVPTMGEAGVHVSKHLGLLWTVVILLAVC